MAGLQVVLDFRVVDESDDWIIVDKPAPLIVHPTNRKPEPTLLGGLESLLAFEIETGRKPAVVNRLDRDTSGLVLVAKHRDAASELGKAFERREVEKEYVAVVAGWPDVEEWECREPIVRAGVVATSKIWVRQVVDPRGKPCATRFRVERRFERGGERFCVVRCFPETGRMHQIRVHLADGGHPIVGDKLYAGDGEEYIEWMAKGWTPALRERLHLPRQALHADRMALPWRGEWLDWRIGMPDDLDDFVAGREIKDTPNVVIWDRNA